MSPQPFTNPLGPLELTTVLIRHHGIHEGLWTLKVEFHTSGHNIATQWDATALPAVMVGVRSVSLREVEIADQLTIDAAAVNPAKT